MILTHILNNKKRIHFKPITDFFFFLEPMAFTAILVGKRKQYVFARTVHTISEMKL